MGAVAAAVRLGECPIFVGDPFVAPTTICQLAVPSNGTDAVYSSPCPRFVSRCVLVSTASSPATWFGLAGSFAEAGIAGSPSSESSSSQSAMNASVSGEGVSLGLMVVRGEGSSLGLVVKNS